MERFNPFASSTGGIGPDELDGSLGSSALTRTSDTAVRSMGGSMGAINRQSAAAASRTESQGADRARQEPSPSAAGTSSTPSISSRYTTSFPDPFGDGATGGEQPSAGVTTASSGQQQHAARSSSVTFANSLEEPAASSVAIQQQQAATGSRPTRGQASGGLSSFLSRATSVTSSSVTDAVGSVRSAVDSLSSQIQQAVPSNINERLSSTLIGGQDPPPEQQQQQSAASYLASKLSSATNQFVTSSSSPSSGSLPVISRQRIVLILDSAANADWAQQFVNYRRLIAGLNPLPSGQSALSNFITSATAQLTSGGGNSFPGEGADLVEQADFRDVSVLANQSSSTAIVLVHSPSTGSGSSPLLSGSSRQQVSSPGARNLTASGARIIRPEFVVVRQRCSQSKGGASSDHLRGIVTAFNYCLVPMFEPLDVWNTFQDKQLVFARLLRIQRTLGKENFPLIPQVFCQTYQDLLNHINSSTVSLPCLVKTGQLGKGRMKADSLQMLRDFASIVAISGLSCTVEPHLDVKCDLIIQKLGAGLKLFKRTAPPAAETGGAGHSAFPCPSDRQSASRQTSLGSSVLSSLIPSSSLQLQQQQQQQQNTGGRRSSNPGSAFEKMSEVVSTRYRSWVDAVAREFDNKLEAFCLKVVITSQDREYIVGLSDCSMDFMGAQDNRDEDKRSFVELIIGQMNALLPKHSLSREPSANLTPSATGAGGIRRSSSDDKTPLGAAQPLASSLGANASRVQELNSPLGDKKKFISQTQINGVASKSVGADAGSRASAARTYGQLSSRSQSVSVNQSDYLNEQQPIGKSAYFTRRGSDRSDSAADDASALDDDTGSQLSDLFGSAHQRQASLGQSFLDQTSTAFSSIHKQSMSFFRRLDATRADNTPPMSAKSDKAFDRTFAPRSPISEPAADQQQVASGRRNDFKSQSVDYSAADQPSGFSSPNRASMRASGGRRDPPTKPPPPQTLGSRQSSLAASYSTKRGATPSGGPTPSCTPSQSRQNTVASGDPSAIEAGSSASGQNKTRIVRQNSALSAFEPFDPDLRLSSDQQHAGAPASSSPSQTSSADASGGRAATSGLDGRQTVKSAEQHASMKRGSQFDSASITSGDSNSTNETTTAEDTMNNLKKTFASIFGDKCE